MQTITVRDDNDNVIVKINGSRVVISRNQYFDNETKRIIIHLCEMLMNIKTGIVIDFVEFKPRQGFNEFCS
jgi:hypothetical protein